MVIPAMRGHLGTMVFYTANLKLKELVKLVNYGNGDKLCCSDLSQETYPYALADNGFKIKDHLLAYNGFFFNAIVLVVCDGDPRWREIRYEIDGVMYSNMGLLELSGSEQIFPLGGQHRLEGIRTALKESEECTNDSIPVILIGADCILDGNH